MPNTCSICKHKDRAAIDQALARGESLRDIARQFSVGKDSVGRHQQCIAGLLEAARMRAAAEIIIDLETEIREGLALGKRLRSACDAYLIDPEDHNRYTLEPRAEEVNVIYTKLGARGGSVRMKDKLSVLLARLEKSPKFEGVTFERVETRTSDPRELLLKTLEQIRKQNELYARLIGAFKDRPAQPPPEEKFDLVAIKIEDMREQGREVSPEEAARLVEEDTAHFVRLAIKTGQQVKAMPGVH